MKIFKLILIVLVLLGSCHYDELNNSSFKTIVLTSSKNPKTIFHSSPKGTDYHTLEMYFNETPSFKFYVDGQEFEMMNAKKFIDWLKIGDTIRLQITHQDFNKISNYKHEKLSLENQMIKVYGIHSKYIVFLPIDDVLSKYNERKAREPGIYNAIVIFILILLLSKFRHYIRLRFSQHILKK